MCVTEGKQKYALRTGEQFTGLVKSNMVFGKNRLPKIRFRAGMTFNNSLISPSSKKLLNQLSLFIEIFVLALRLSFQAQASISEEPTIVETLIHF